MPELTTKDKNIATIVSILPAKDRSLATSVFNAVVEEASDEGKGVVELLDWTLTSLAEAIEPLAQGEQVYTIRMRPVEMAVAPKLSTENRADESKPEAEPRFFSPPIEPFAPKAEVLNGTIKLDDDELGDPIDAVFVDQPRSEKANGIDNRREPEPIKVEIDTSRWGMDQPIVDKEVITSVESRAIADITRGVKGDVSMARDGNFVPRKSPEPTPASTTAVGFIDAHDFPVNPKLPPAGIMALLNMVLDGADQAKIQKETRLAPMIVKPLFAILTRHAEVIKATPHHKQSDYKQQLLKELTDIARKKNGQVKV